MNIVIIEDEPRAAQELQHIIHEVVPAARITAVLDSVEQSLQRQADIMAADLVFSDIALGDGQCFDIFRQVDIKSPVIFCTAYDEYLMHAFETNAISYLLKPITREKVEKAIDKFNRMKAALADQSSGAAVRQLLQRLKQPYKSALLVHQKERIIPIQVKEVACFYLDDTLVKITMLHGQQYYLGASLEELEKTLDPGQFYRANRQYLVNRQAIQSVERFFARKLAVRLTIGNMTPVMVSKAKAGEFLQWLEGGGGNAVG
ncbi:LytR/AlgR family response regulator transcription factor [Chitinophaga japonensis]|uniref:LytTR family two component transcriptional regulator n=1 Tax=Chitinophaga japonensis TaxID=104662 RepID=A0A562TH21_CHIJA|nr:LytTR family DNA-binding domain-containing protein [Chitinophaga japonensis]TWI92140.1 LytTR family two component transcriptional regulator [Chitinophaga japonensis]